MKAGQVRLRDGRVIEPQPGPYDFDGSPPQRIDDLARIRLPAYDFRWFPKPTIVILLDSKDGRQWLVKQ